MLKYVRCKHLGLRDQDIHLIGRRAHGANTNHKLKYKAQKLYVDTNAVADSAV